MEIAIMQPYIVESQIIAQRVNVHFTDALRIICLLYTSGLWGRSTAVTAVSSRQSRDAPADAPWVAARSVLCSR